VGRNGVGVWAKSDDARIAQHEKPTGNAYAVGGAVVFGVCTVLGLRAIRSLQVSRPPQCFSRRSGIGGHGLDVIAKSCFFSILGDARGVASEIWAIATTSGTEHDTESEYAFFVGNGDFDDPVDDVAGDWFEYLGIGVGIRGDGRTL